MMNSGGQASPPLFACIKLLKNARAVFRPVLLGKKDREQYPTSPNKRGTGDLCAFVTPF